MFECLNLLDLRFLSLLLVIKIFHPNSLSEVGKIKLEWIHQGDDWVLDAQIKCLFDSGRGTKTFVRVWGSISSFRAWVCLWIPYKSQKEEYCHILIRIYHVTLSESRRQTNEKRNIVNETRAARLSKGIVSVWWMGDFFFFFAAEESAMKLRIGGSNGWGERRNGKIVRLSAFLKNVTHPYTHTEAQRQKESL